MVVHLDLTFTIGKYSKKCPLFFSQKTAKKHIGKNKKITDMGKVSKIAGLRLFLGGKNDPRSKVRVEK